MAIDFYGPNLKVKRAEHHIGTLEAMFGQYVDENVKRFQTGNRNTFQKTIFPEHTPTVLGDALHNLRAALDHAYHIVADANGAISDDHRRFPFGKDKQSVSASIDGHKKNATTPSDKVISAILDEVQPYEGGKLGLYGLHRLDITDKHQVLISTVSRMAVDRPLTISRPGQPKITIQGATLQGTHGKGSGDILKVDSGEVTFDGDPSDIHLCFAEGQPFQGSDILATVRSLKEATTDALTIMLRAAS
jgi:hypothetical protein